MAQVEVVDRPVSEPTSEQAQDSAIERPVAQTAAPASNNIAELFYQIQLMQQELMELRGQVDEQNHLIKQLKQQRLDDYVDLDRRIAELGQAAPAPAGATRSPAASSSSLPVASQQAAQAGQADSASEMAHYKSATKLILVEKNYDAGVARLQEHLTLYPKGRYAGNSMYWLGEVHLAKSELPEARQWFERLLAEFPLHSKANDAKYKLATVLHQQGDDSQAKALLQEVSISNSSAAKLAQNYLRENF
ncbi:YbgF trimerization domain-containing protein [Agaribacterium haliotis]|uniref:YbgF trimerization domain-containing protein n=1 Tax=Agaribacterium haliotis TaxID=2013869 RepID=UPI001EFEF0AB|nr:YbgF trimerization domain-containing protein [Agaribacterium haliotis]